MTFSLADAAHAPAALAKQALYFLDLIDRPSRRLQQICAAFVGDNYIVIERDYIEEWMRVTKHADGRTEVRSMGQVRVRGHRAYHRSNAATTLQFTRLCCQVVYTESRASISSVPITAAPRPYVVEIVLHVRDCASSPDKAQLIQTSADS